MEMMCAFVDSSTHIFEVALNNALVFVCHLTMLKSRRFLMYDRSSLVLAESLSSAYERAGGGF